MTPVNLPHARRSPLSARSARASQPKSGVKGAVVNVLTTVATAGVGSIKNSVAGCSDTIEPQLVTRRIGILGEPAFPPGTRATAVPVSKPPQFAAAGIVTVLRMSPTAASAGRAIVP